MIAVNQLTKAYGDTKIIDGMSFELPAATSMVVVGPSGSGKTTLLRLIAGLETPDSGEIYSNGMLVSRGGWALEPHRRGIGFVFQSSALWPHMTVAENILFGLKALPRNEARQRTEELLAEASLTHLKNRYPDQISGGEARRVAILRSLAPRPASLLMDEPLTNLDAKLKDKLLLFIKETVKRTGSSLIYVTHDAGEASQLAEQVLSLAGG